MSRILTGIQSSGKPHLGNILGAILPSIKLSENKKNEALFFIADLHSLTTVKEATLVKSYTNALVASWIAFGFNTDDNIFYRQSRIPEVTELSWYLSCFTPIPMLKNAHSYKDKANKLSSINAGLFTYPILMASDILMYNADLVPVGKDQQQHLEMARDIAKSFNNYYNEEIFILPKAIIDESVMTILGTDGQKMSKSYGNTIDIFLPKEKLRKQVMGIITATIPLEAPKNPDSCTVFSLYKLLASPSQVKEMRENYERGNYGFGTAKETLYELILHKYKNERILFNELVNDTTQLESKLQEGEEKARIIGLDVLNKVRKIVGFK